MRLEVATQPAAVKQPGKQSLQINPIWVVGPRTSFEKSRKVCSLITDICDTNGRSPITRLLTRLSINIWKMSMRHFNGILRAIRARMARSLSEQESQKPETLERLYRLPEIRLKRRENRMRHIRKCHPCGDGCTSMRLSTKVDLVLIALNCTKCKRGLATEGLRPTDIRSVRVS